MPDTVEFVVYGKPAPQGSMKAFYVKSLGRAVLTSDNKRLKPWRQQISETANSLGVVAIERDTPVAVTADFYFERPAGAPKRRKGMTVKPDSDKLVRAILDALTGILYIDDAQVVDLHPRKFYGVPERVEIRVSEAVL